jgi:hypothetical protein
MSRWARGEAEIDRLLAEGGLQQVSGAAADGEAWLEKAARVLGTARAIVTGDPESAYVLVYDAARQACVGLLAHQGLRATSKGGHYVVERAVRAQFGDGFKGFGALRRRRNELEYPSYPGEQTEPGEVEAAIAVAERIIEAARGLLPNVGRF